MVNAVDNNVSGYRIDATSGALTPIAGSPFPAGSFPRSVVVDPGGKFAYVANQVSNNVSAFRINESGALTEITGSPFTAGVGPCSVAISSTGAFAFVVNEGGGNISAYQIQIDGGLRSIADSPFAAGNDPVDVIVHPSGPICLRGQSGQQRRFGFSD